MKRIQEKIKDLVEVRPYRSLHDFISEPAETLAAYHFTDATAEMMSHWLDRIADVQIGSGAAKALAGYRGVGKSHFLATLGAIVSNPELRSRITNQYVAASAQRLKRRRHPVAHARRGTHDTLLAEIKAAIGETLDVDVSLLSDDLSGLLAFAAEKATDLPFVLFIDTAHDRASRVARDDGALLGELALTAKDFNVFVGVALDDDIADADGANSSIVQNYTIDYLDQEHLYRIVEAHLFPKNRNSSPLLHQIYQDFREILPGFRWSEQRFVALYPLHPAIVEVAPFVRLYAPDFALLGFASDAATKILGRPAHSLVALDEVFERMEPTLRKVSDLQEAFELYDRINADVISHIPVMQRLQAKLVLKALMLLSLDGDGTTAGEICAAVLIYNEAEPAQSRRAVEELLETFVSIFPDQIKRLATDGRETRFSFKVSAKDNLNDALAVAAQNVSPEVAEKVLRRFARERFPDWALPEETDTPGANSHDCQIVWRGGTRRGRVIWNWDNHHPSIVQEADKEAESWDWQVVVGTAGGEKMPSDSPFALWRPAELRADETETLRRYYVLATDRQLREVYGDQMRSAGHAHHTAVERIWRRIFLEAGTLQFDGSSRPVSDLAQDAQSLSELFSAALAPLFLKLYPQHPVFSRTLGMDEVSHLVSEHFSGAKTGVAEVQGLAQTFALPLGLVVERGGNYLLETEDRLLRQPFAAEVMRLVGDNQDGTVLLETIYERLKRPPHGLAREAQHLVLAALVAQRMLEFVTAQGDRINRRSLDLKIIWDDIVGVARPSTVLYGSEDLTKWARILTSVDTFANVDDSRDAELIRRALEDWLSDWRESRVIERFDELPDDVLSTKIWGLASGTRKTFGAVAATVEAILNNTISLEEGLQRVAEAFADSEKQFFKSTSDLVALEDFVNGAAEREKIWKYLAHSETTEDERVEQLRAALGSRLEEIARHPSQVLNREMIEAWDEFHRLYVEHFTARHDAVMKAHHLQEQFDEIIRSDAWWEFESLSRLPFFQGKYWRDVRNAVERLSELNCPFDVREMLEDEPSCACSFRLAQESEWESNPARLKESVDRARQSYRRTLQILSPTLAPLIENFAETETNGESVAAARRLADIISAGEAMPQLGNAELNVLSRITRRMSEAPLLAVEPPTEIGFVSQPELRARLAEWLDDLPDEPVLLKV